MPRGDSPIPDRPADLVERDHIGAAQNLLYRLTGDTNLVHVDRAVAAARRAFEEENWAFNPRLRSQCLSAWGAAMRANLEELAAWPLPGSSPGSRSGCAGCMRL